MQQELTDKQRAFVREYMRMLAKPRVGGDRKNNATEAVKLAGYRCKSQTATTTQAHRLLANPKIAAAILRFHEEAQQRTEITVDRVAQEYARIAFSNISDMLEFDCDSVTVRTSSELDDDVLAAIAEVQQVNTKESRRIAIKLHSKLEALAGLRRLLGLDPAEHSEITGKDGGPIVIQYAEAVKEDADVDRDPQTPPETA